MNGQAIRTGQENGEIARRGQGGGPRSDYLRNGQTVRVDLPAEDRKISPSEFVSGDSYAARDMYALADDVSDEQFEEAIDRAQVYAELGELIAAHRFGEARDLMCQLLEETS